MLRLLIKLYESVPNPDWVNICQCLMFLDDSQEVAKILHNLIEGTEVRNASARSADIYFGRCACEVLMEAKQP